MKKIFSILLILLCSTIIIPLFFTKPFETISKSIEEQNETKYDYRNLNTIKLLHTATNEIEEVNLDDYLCNVVSAEMPASYETEALKAQAIVARTYTIYQIVSNTRKARRSRYM